MAGYQANWSLFKMKKLWILFIVALGPLFPQPAGAYTSTTTATSYMVENSSGTNNCYYFNTTNGCSATIVGLTGGGGGGGIVSLSTGVIGTLGTVNGGTGASLSGSIPNAELLIGNGSVGFGNTTVPSCSGQGNAVVFNTVADAFQCTPILNSTGTLLSGTTLYVTSGTISGPGGFQVESFAAPLEKPNTIDNPLVHILLESAIGTYPGAQTDGLFVDTLDTGTNTNPLNDLISGHFLVRQFAGSNSQLIGVWSDAYGQGPGSPNIAAYYAVPAWAGDTVTGSTTPLIGLQLTPRVTSLNGLVNRATGTIILINIPDFTNGTGAPGNNFIFKNFAHFPIFTAGNIGIGQVNPAGALTIAVDSNTAYSLIAGTMAFNNYNTQLLPSQYTFSVSSGGVITSNGVHNFISTLVANSSAAVQGSFTVGSSTVSTISAQNVVLSTSTLTYNTVLATGPSVSGTVGTDKYLLTAGGGLAVIGAVNVPVPYTATPALSLSGAESFFSVQNGLGNGAGLNIQGTAVSGTGFIPGHWSQNAVWDQTNTRWTIGNNFQSGYDSMYYGGAVIGFSMANNLTVPTTLTHSQYLNNDVMIISAGAGPGGGGVQIGSNTVPTAGLDVRSSSGVSVSYGVTMGSETVQTSTNSVYEAKWSTSTAAGTTYQIGIATSGVFTVGASSSPLPTSCGTSPTITGTNAAMVVTPGAGAAGCTITFNPRLKNTPSCTVTQRTGSVTNTLSYVPSATAITVTETALSSVLDIHCVGQNE